VLVSQWLADYAGLMTPLPAAQQQLWGGITELFDNYLLACFILFSGVSLQTLVWQDDCLPNRLRTALLRITTSSGCKYKEEVGWEEVWHTRLELLACCSWRVLFWLTSGLTGCAHCMPTAG
jgi:hypothetical protein